MQKIVEEKLKQNPNDKKIFEKIVSKTNNSVQYNGRRMSNTIHPSIDIIKPTSLKRLMSISPYTTIPNRVKYSWVNNPGHGKIYEMKLKGGLMDQEGNRFKHVSHGSSTIFLKDKIEKMDLLKKLLDFNFEDPLAKKAVKIKNIREIIKLKTGKIYPNLLFKNCLKISN